MELYWELLVILYANFPYRGFLSRREKEIRVWRRRTFHLAVRSLASSKGTMVVMEGKAS